MDSVLSTSNSHNESTIQNKGFILLDNMFKNNGWLLIKNEMNWICYNKPGYETEYFEIQIERSKIFVSIPIKNSVFQYRTSFKDYFSVTEYIEERFKDFRS